MIAIFGYLVFRDILLKFIQKLIKKLKNKEEEDENESDSDEEL